MKLEERIEQLRKQHTIAEELLVGYEIEDRQMAIGALDVKERTKYTERLRTRQRKARILRMLAKLES